MIPLNVLYAYFGFTPSLTLDGFVLFESREPKFPACGTYFSVTNLVGPNCYAGFVLSRYESSHTPLAPLVTLPCIGDAEPDDAGQYGFLPSTFLSPSKPNSASIK